MTVAAFAAAERPWNEVVHGEVAMPSTAVAGALSSKTIGGHVMAPFSPLGDATQRRSGGTAAVNTLHL